MIDLLSTRAASPLSRPSARLEDHRHGVTSWKVVAWSELPQALDVYEGSGEVRTGLFAGNNPVNFIDPWGLEWQFSLGISGTIGGHPIPIIPGGFVGGSTSLGFTSSGQLFVQFQAAGMAGVGAFAGVGAQGGVSHSDCPTPAGVSTQNAAHGEVNAGWGPAGGASADVGNGSQSAGFPPPDGGRFGVGYGAMAGAGASTTTTIATPSAGQMYNSAVNAGASFFNWMGF